MDESHDDKFRPRYDETAGGLTRDESRKPRPSSHGLVVEKLADADVAKGLQLVPLVDRLMPDADREDGALAVADFGIAGLLAEQRSERLNTLIERAQTLISGGQWRPALAVIQEARAADPASTQAVLLLAQCLVELGHYEPALRVVSFARDHETDPEVRALLLRREAACIRATTKVLETRLVELVASGDLKGALHVVQQGLARQPSNVVFLHHMAKVYCLLADMEAARRTIEEVRRHVGRENIDLIAELERAIEFGPHAAAVEAARQALRRGDAAAALEHLKSCSAGLSGNEHYDGLLDYARALRPGALGLFRGPKTGPTSSAAGQQTLRWVLSEELREGDKALRGARYTLAQKAFADAGRIDARCGAVCFGHAQALYLEHKAGGGAGRPLGSAAQQALGRAEELAVGATIDGDYQEAAEALIKAIRELRQQ